MGICNAKMELMVMEDKSLAPTLDNNAGLSQHFRFNCHFKYNVSPDFKPVI